MLNLKIKKIENSIIVEGQDGALIIDIVNEKIENIIEQNFQFELWSDCIRWIKETALNKSIHEVLSYSWETLFNDLLKNEKPLSIKNQKYILDFENKQLPMINLPLEMLKEGLLHFIGQDEFLLNEKRMFKKNLLCRCFGIENKEIYSLIYKNRAINNSFDITNHCSAGAGCGSCLKDLDHLFNKDLEIEGISSPVELSLKINSLINNNSDQVSGEDILLIKGPIVFFKTKVSDETLLSLNKLINNILKQKLFFVTL